MKSIYIDSTIIHSITQDIGLYVLKGIEGLELPPIRTASFENPASDGAFLSNQLYGGRLISFTGLVSGTCATDYRSKRDQIITAFSIERENGSVTPKTFKFTTLIDQELQATFYTKDFSFTDEDVKNGTYRVDLFCPDQRIESQTLSSLVIYLFSGGGFAIPFGIPFDMSTGGSTTDELTNNGNIDSFLNITLNGPLTNPTIDNLTTGEQLTITKTLTTSSERIEIDTKNRTVLYFSTPTATGVNALADQSGDWIFLQPGSNEIKLTNATYNSEASAEFTWRDAYVGV